MNLFKKLFGTAKNGASQNEFVESEFSLMKKTDFNNFEDLLNQHAGYSFEKQLNFNELTGNVAWNIDLNTGMLSFGTLQFPMQVIGSLSFNDYSWMWGWANTKSGIPENLLDGSSKLKALGEKKELEELKKGHFMATEGFEHKMGLVASGLLDADAYFCANYGQGTMVVTVKSDSIPEIDDNNVERVLTTFPQLISGIDLNHQESFKNYLIDRGFKLKLTDRKIEGVKNGKLLIAEFDELSRLIKLNGKI
ncbi:DUF6882 domain-containing protein [Sungkyunkwania multivorans]|uniref:DUF6882 domain-containing protein n=1 Tax=Sungkyunkwania multivorans TaxID=1173618 RepID=A0ABW3CUL5_9FLAO